jgi:hypothetical protein
MDAINRPVPKSSSGGSFSMVRACVDVHLAKPGALDNGVDNVSVSPGTAPRAPAMLRSADTRTSVAPGHRQRWCHPVFAE